MLWYLHWNLWKITNDSSKSFPTHFSTPPIPPPSPRVASSTVHEACARALGPQLQTSMHSMHQSTTYDPWGNGDLWAYLLLRLLSSNHPSGQHWFERFWKYIKRHLCNLLLRSLCMDCFCDGFGLTKTELGGSAFNGCLWLMYCWLAISVHFLCGLLFFPEHRRNCVHPAKHRSVIAHDSWWSSHFSWLLNSFSINVVQRPLHPLHHELRCRADHSKWSFLPSRAFLFTRDAGTRLEVQLALVASPLFEHGKGWPDSIVALTWLYRLGVGAVLLAAGLILLAGALARGWLLAVSMMRLCILGVEGSHFWKRAIPPVKENQQVSNASFLSEIPCWSCLCSSRTPNISTYCSGNVALQAVMINLEDFN